MNLQRLSETLLSMVDCLTASLEAIEEAGGPGVCISTLLPGDTVPLDYCAGEDDCGGMAWVRLMGITPDQMVDTTTTRSCWQPMEAMVEVGVVRGYEFDGEALPSEDAQLGMSIRQIDDAAAVARAIQCCSAEYEIQVQAYEPTGPEGGCYGGRFTVRVPL